MASDPSMLSASAVGDSREDTRESSWSIAGLAAVSAWVGLTFVVAWCCRFWINSDTIGTLDAARALGSLELEHALNGYFGTGFALMLAPLDLDDPDSFLGVHVVSTVLLLTSQALLHVSLLRLGLERGLAGLLSVVWAATAYASGSAVFMTADVALCFWAALYLWIVTRHVSFDQVSIAPVAALGLIHVIAGVTKAIAFPTFLFFPLGFVGGALLVRRRGGTPGGLTRRDLVRFTAAYLVPLLLAGGVWAVACQATYGRLTLGGTGTYNYARFTQTSESLEQATLTARRELLPDRTYWWSDPNLSIDGWDREIRVDIADPLRRIGENVWHYLSDGKDLVRAAVLLALLGFSGLAFVGFMARGLPLPRGSGLLALVGLVCVGGYLIITVYPRHLTYPALLCLPVAGIALQRLLDLGPRVRSGVRVVLALALAHGVAAMGYAAFSAAPDDTLFRIADRLEGVAPGPVGVVLDPGRGIRSPGVIAFLADRGAAELVPLAGEADFRAGFSPEIVLWVRRSTGEPPPTVTVNGRTFRRPDDGIWHTRGDKSIALYL